MLLTQKLKLNLKMLEVSFFKTTHSIPESMGIVLGTDQGNIVYTGTSSLTKPSSHGKTDLVVWLKSDEGVLASCQTQQMRQVRNKTASEAAVGQEIDQVIADAEGRVIAAAKASNLVRIQQV